MSILSQFRQSQNTDFPNLRPSLDLRFALAKKLDPRITFTRGSTATYFGPDGLMRTASVNEPRFDHDPVSGQSLGLLVESSKINLITNSIFLSNMPDKTNVTVTDNSIISPDGTQNASKIIETPAVASHLLSQLNVSTTQNTTYTISGYFKRGERKVVGISFRNVTFWGTPNSPAAIFNLDTGTLVITTGVIVSTSITPVGNGWYRCSATATRDSNGTITSGISVGILNDSNQGFYSGIVGYGIYAWGLQFEAGVGPTSYIPTLGSTVTRSADVASMTGTNFSSWYNQSEGTMISSCISRRPNNSGNGADFSILNSTGSSRIVGWFNTGASPLFVVVQNNNTVLLPFVGTPSGQLNIPIKKAISLSDKNIRVSTNGKIITGDLGNAGVQDTLPNDFNRLLIGYEGLFADYFIGTINRLTYYPIKLTDQQLINLSS
jgi:hypothetical protein